MLSQLRTKYSLDEIRCGCAEEVSFAPGASEKHFNDEQGSPAEPGLCATGARTGAAGPRGARTTFSGTAGGEPHGLLANDNPKAPQSQNLEMQWDTL